MPSLIGMPVLTAQNALAKAGIKTDTPLYEILPASSVGSGNTPPAAPVMPGSVTAQTPPAGARVDQTTIVKLTVAR
jgi:beta-lactam-binding protein with PASTA domain